MEVTIEDCQKKKEDNIGKDLQQTKERLQEEKQKNEEFRKNINLLEGYMEKFRKQLDEMGNALTSTENERKKLDIENENLKLEINTLKMEKKC